MRSSKRKQTVTPLHKHMLYTIGITGGIGSGKSFICHQLEEAGFKVFYCDDEAKRIMRTNSRLKDILTSVVGNGLYDENGELNKEVMSAFLRRGKQEADLVNALIHPLVGASWLRLKTDWLLKACCAEGSATRLSSTHPHRQISLERLLSLPPAHTLVMECALLFESDFCNLVDHSVLVHVSQQTQLNRLMARNHISEEQAQTWIDLQMSEEERMKRADFILDNEQDRNK